jgi:hypothetical protein
MIRSVPSCSAALALVRELELLRLLSVSVPLQTFLYQAFPFGSLLADCERGSGPRRDS